VSIRPGRFAGHNQCECRDCNCERPARFAAVCFGCVCGNHDDVAARARDVAALIGMGLSVDCQVMHDSDGNITGFALPREMMDRGRFG
jgi:hypothetical protein